MGILSRFADIVSANINALLDKAEDPGKMVDQYMRKMTNDLAQVKKETAGVMAEESRTKRLVQENEKEVAKFTELAKRALVSGSEDDARVFLAKKHELEDVGAGLQTAAAAAHENAIKMRQMHDKLVKDINTLNARRQTIKAKAAVARTQDKVNKLSGVASGAEGAMSAFSRMEDKINMKLDMANAEAELNSSPIDAALALEEKYKGVNVDSSVCDELAAMKAQLGLN
ncbi:MAG: PspA/IM30 family protein [Defluviitaleaceae bacterium]|nr:PspA/IM30 family protein [Defluviitaleaceae bacterium]